MTMYMYNMYIHMHVHAIHVGVLVHHALTCCDDVT